MLVMGKGKVNRRQRFSKISGQRAIQNKWNLTLWACLWWRFCEHWWSRWAHTLSYC